jgi:hypothetical protein
MLRLVDERREVALRLSQGGALHETNMTRIAELAQAEPCRAPGPSKHDGGCESRPGSPSS